MGRISQDSTYKAVIDTVIAVYKIHSGEKISSLPLPAWTIKSLDIHPSGSHLVVMGDDSLHVYDLIKDNLANTGTTSLLDGDSTTVRPYDDAWVDVEGQDEIHFSSDGNNMMTIYYRESEYPYTDGLTLNTLQLNTWAWAETNFGGKAGKANWFSLP